MSTALLRCSLGDLPILSGSLRLRARGPWGAVVDAHAAEELAELSPAAIVLTREDTTEDVFAGRVRRSALNDGRAQLCVTVVGAAGLAATIDPLDHMKGATELPAGLVARSICDAAGELLEDGAEAALDALTLPHWTRLAGPAAGALDVLAHVLGLGWRVLPTGRVRVAAETWPAGPDLRRLGYQLEDGGRRYGPDGAQVLPGMVLEGMRIADVVYMLGGPLRAEARQHLPSDPALVPDLTAYRQVYVARVVGQAADDTLEVVPDDPALGSEARPLRGIPLRVGIPGCRTIVPPGARVRVAFEVADPRRPYACALDADPTAARPLALVGDSAGYVAGTCAAAPGPVSLTWSATPTGVPGEAQVFVSGPGHKFARGVPG